MLIKEFLPEITHVNRYNDQVVDKRGAHLIALLECMHSLMLKPEPTVALEKTFIIDESDSSLEMMPAIPFEKSFNRSKL